VVHCILMKPTTCASVSKPFAARRTRSGAMGAEVRRGSKVIKPLVAPVGPNRCSPLVQLAVPAPTGKGKIAKRVFQLRAVAGKRSDPDLVTLQCIEQERCTMSPRRLAREESAPIAPDLPAGLPLRASVRGRGEPTESSLTV
jgi:hypothetical protein